jgi:rubrerythrin
MEKPSVSVDDRPLAEHVVRCAGTMSRRRFGVQAALAGAGAIAFGTRAGAPVGAAPLGPSPTVYADDIDILVQLLAVEHLTYALYRQGISRMAARPADEPALSVSLPVIRRLRDQEGRHVGLLTALLAERNGPIAAIPGYDFGYADGDGFLQVAATIENAAVATYTGAVPTISDPWLRRALTAVLAVEARHAAYLSGAIGASPFPQASETVANKLPTLLFVERFVAS